jgi:hypothetical protein
MLLAKLLLPTNTYYKTRYFFAVIYCCKERHTKLQFFYMNGDKISLSKDISAMQESVQVFGGETVAEYKKVGSCF